MPALDLTDPVAIPGADDRAAARQRLSTRLLFLIVGIANATWAPLVPLVKDRAGLDAAGLGLLLLTFLLIRYLLAIMPLRMVMTPRATRATFIPSSPNSRPAALPMPRLPPVIIAVLPLSSRSMKMLS